MTDNKIIKALEKLYDEAHKGYVTHLEHNGPRDTSHEEYIDLMSATLDLIQRQQIEIKKLKTDYKAMKKDRDNCWKEFKCLLRICETEKAEAAKEFADRIVKELEGAIIKGLDKSNPASMWMNTAIRTAINIVRGVQNENL